MFAYQYWASGQNIWGSRVNNTISENNIFYENGVARPSSGANGISFTGVGTNLGITIRNNIFYASGSGRTGWVSSHVQEGSHYTQSGNMINTEPPGFVNGGSNSLPTSPDFRLLPGSPAIDSGLSVSAVKTDFYGTPRPQGAGYDIGAHEFSDNPPTTACSLSQGDANYCKACGPCDKGVGNCTDDVDCASGLQCAADVGSVYGFGATVDVCEPPAPSLANTYTMSASSPDLINPVTNLWDGCTDGKASCTTGSSSLSSFWVEFDLGEVHRLSSARLFGDANDNWRSGSWSLSYKLLPGDGWTTAVDAQNALLNDWSTAELDVFAQFVRVEVNAPAEGTATEARELEIHGAPEEPSAPNPEPTPEPPAPDPEGGESNITCVENADGSKTCSGTLSRECTEPDADGNRQCTVTGVGCAVMTGSPGLFALALLWGIGALRRRRRT